MRFTLRDIISLGPNDAWSTFSFSFLDCYKTVGIDVGAPNGRSVAPQAGRAVSLCPLVSLLYYRYSIYFIYVYIYFIYIRINFVYTYTKFIYVYTKFICMYIKYICTYTYCIRMFLICIFLL